ncbi:MAG: hypothetical protein HYV41_03635, partial [Candidatus Magasanikbacteria bacterium]|nr:hypothetical protein [Candidatus Magasanikbacteria bacterium]
FRHEFIFVVCTTAILFLTHFVSRTHRRILWFLLLSYVCVAIPFTFLQFDPLTNSGERYAYTISVFFVLYLVMLIYVVLEKFSKRNVIFTGILFVLIAGSVIQLYSKIKIWHYAGQVRDTIISQVEAFKFGDTDYVVFFALPDNIEGAEVFRNAIQETIVIETDNGFVAGERIPMYLELTVDQIGKRLFELKESSQGVYTFSPDLPERRIFTGFYDYRTPLFRSRMDKFMAYGQSGTDIRLTIRPHVLELYKQQGKNVYLAYFDGEKMNFIEL